jgi:serine/threonine protein kinase
MVDATLPLGAAPRYRLEEQLGEGGMGVVHAATMLTPAGERRVAMKCVVTSVSGPRQAAARERLLAEGRLVFQLTHANICQVIDVAEGEDGATYIVMEYVSGADLARVVRRRRRLELAHALYVGREVARALDYAHRKKDSRGRSLGIIHGDLSPRNVLLSLEGEVKLADFGVSRALGVTAPGSGVVAGTPGFAAPEVRSGIFDGRADVYGLGVCMYVALTGIWPASDAFAPDRLAHSRPEVSRALEEIVARATARNPGHRFQSSGELEEALAVELSRTAPAFRPTHLAEVVSIERASSERSSRTPVRETVVRSLIATVPHMRPTASSGSQMAPNGATRTLSRSDGARPSRRRLVAVLTAASFGLAGGLLWVVSPWQATRTAPRRAAAPAAADPEPDGSRAPTGLPAAEPFASAPDAATSAAPERQKIPRRRRVKDREESRDARPPAAQESRLTVTAEPWGILFIDGKRVADETPVFDLAIPAGRHAVKVYFPSLGRFSRSRRIVFEPGARRTLVFAP